MWKQEYQKCNEAYEFVNGESNKHMLGMTKTNRSFGESECTYMSVHAMYLTLQAMKMEYCTRLKIIDTMVETTLEAYGGRGYGRK